MTMSTDDWSDVLAPRLGNTPLEFVLKWIAVESGGNPCATGAVSGSFVKEAGIGQVYFESPSQRTFGVTLGELRAACSGTSQAQQRDLTGAELAAQADSLMAMVHHFEDVATQQLGRFDGLSWNTRDFYCLVKLQHGLPGIPKSYLSSAVFGEEAPVDWGTFRAAVESMSISDLSNIDNGTARYASGFGKVFNNAEKTASVLSADPIEIVEPNITDSDELIVPGAITVAAIALGKFGK